ncbi:MAG: hypothetical protein GY765_30560, partial [bacterium]|nr:hypothetical protein [bacterium]
HFRALAETDIPLKTGDNFPFTVLAMEPQLTLQIGDQHVGITPEIRNTISKIEILPGADIGPVDNLTQSLGASTKSGMPDNIKDALTRLGEHFKLPDINKEFGTLFSQLNKHIFKSGLFFEKDLAKAIEPFISKDNISTPKELSALPQIKEILTGDLKPNLLVLQEYFHLPNTHRDAKDAGLLDNLRQITDRLLENIDSQQKSAMEKESSPQNQQDPAQVFHFSIPIKQNNKN